MTKKYLIIFLLLLFLISCKKDEVKIFQKYSDKVEFFLNCNTTIHSLYLKAKNKKAYKKYRENTTKKEIKEKFSDNKLEFKFDSIKILKGTIQFLDTLSADSIILEIITQMEVGAINIKGIKYNLIKSLSYQIKNHRKLNFLCKPFVRNYFTKSCGKESDTLEIDLEMAYSINKSNKITKEYTKNSKPNSGVGSFYMFFIGSGNQYSKKEFNYPNDLKYTLAQELKHTLQLKNYPKTKIIWSTLEK